MFGLNSDNGRLGVGTGKNLHSPTLIHFPGFSSSSRDLVDGSDDASRSRFEIAGVALSSQTAFVLVHDHV